MLPSLNQFIAISLSDSRILIRFSIVLAKLERVLSSAKFWAKATNIKLKKSMKNMLNKKGPTTEPCGTSDIIS